MTNEELVLRIKAGDREAVPALWEQVRRLCFLILRRFAAGHEENLAAHGVTMEDLKQEAFLGMLEAVDSFSPGKELAFVTYLAHPIRKRARELCGLRTRREKPLDSARSLEEPIGKEITLGDALEDKGARNTLESVLDDVFRDELREAMEECLDTLPADWGLTIRARYFTGLTFKEIGKRAGCAPETVRQKERQAIRRMGCGNNLRRLSPFMDELRTARAYRGTGLSAFRYAGSSTERTALWAIERTEERRKRTYGQSVPTQGGRG